MNVLNDEELKERMLTLTAPKVTEEQVEAQVVSEDYHVFPKTCLTVCVLTLKNGFTVSGESGCASPENFDEEIGRTYARRAALSKIWGLEAYVLRNRLTLLEGVHPPAGKIATLGSPATYIGTKVIHAVAMTRAEYNELRGWVLPENENGDDEGYLVEYTDSGNTNQDGFIGYISWSPKDVFEKAYTVGVTLRKSTFLTRLEEEFKQLNDRLSKLTEFIGSEKFQTLPQGDGDDLLIQHEAMLKYRTILMIRLDKLSK